MFRKHVTTTDGRGVVIPTRLEYAPGIFVTITVDCFDDRPIVRWPPKTSHAPEEILDFAEGLAFAAEVARVWSEDPSAEADEVARRALEAAPAAPAEVPATEAPAPLPRHFDLSEIF
jgi:hypothetical protein